MASPALSNRATAPSSCCRQVPVHIVWEILLRLPVKSLLRFKSACKSWRALISDPNFVSSHREQSRRKPKIMIRPITLQEYCSTNSDWRNLALYYYCEERRDLELLFEQKLPTGKEFFSLHPYHLNGLIMLYSSSYIQVSNPSTREVITLPQKNRGSENRSHCDGLGHDPVSNKYKAVNLFDESSRTLGCCVFTIGVDDSWRVVANAPQGVYVLRNSVPVDGVLYWPCVKGRIPITTFDLAITFDLTMAFDLRDETFRFVALPEEAINCFLLLPMGKRLCLFGFSLTVPWQIIIWALQDSDDAWIKKYSFASTSPEELSLIRASHSDDDDNSLIQVTEGLVYYNLPTGRYRLLESTSNRDLKNKHEMQKFRPFERIEHFHAILYAESLTSITK